MHRHSERGGATLIAGAVGLAMLIITGIGIVMSKTDSNIEKDALKRVEEVANDPRLKGTRAQREAAAAAPGQRREQRLADGKRALNVLGAGGKAVGDTVEYINNVDEATNIYAEELYGKSPGRVKLEKIRGRAAAMQRQMKKWQAPDGLQQNSALITKMLRDSDRHRDYLGRGQNLARERKLYPKWSKLSDDEFRDKSVENQLSSHVLRSARGYSLVEQELNDAGLKATPGKVNAVLKKAIMGDKGGSDDFDKALAAAIAAATSLADLDGTYSGSYSGGSSGSCHVTISGTRVSIKLFGSGENKMGAFSADVGGSGTCNRETGSFSGKLSGTVVNQWGSFGCGGSFSGAVANKVASGNWSASARKLPASGTFRASK